MAWHVVIAGGGFGGLQAARTLEKVLPRHSARITLVNDVNFMMPSLRRKLRLLLDWNVGLLFGRDTAELGQLGHPAPLGGEPDLVETTAGGTPPD